MDLSNLIAILQCPVCKSGDIIDVRPEKSGLECTQCSKLYNITEDNIVQMDVPISKPVPEIYSNPEYLKWKEYQSEALSNVFYKFSLFKIIHDWGHKYITGWFKENEKNNWILDLGCGDGAHYDYYESLKSVIGTDNDINSLRVIRKNHPDAYLVQSDCANLPFKDNNIGSVFSIYMLEHIYFLDDTLREINRLLEFPGKLFVGLPCEGGFAWNFGRKISTERILSKKYNIDYKTVIKIEHCNTAQKVIDNLKNYFLIDKKKLFPIKFLPFLSINLILVMQLSVKEP